MTHTPGPWTDDPTQQSEDLIVVLDGGLVQSVVAKSRRLIGLKVAIVDYDVEGADDADLTDVHQPNGTIVRAAVGLDTIEKQEIEIAAEQAQPQTEMPTTHYTPNGWHVEQSRVGSNYLQLLNANGSHIAQLTVHGQPADVLTVKAILNQALAAHRSEEA
jgi:hypothetical protein